MKHFYKRVIQLAIALFVVISHETVVRGTTNDCQLIPINMAEAIIEPFYDPAITGFSKWQIQSGESHGLKLDQFWCWLNIEWARKPSSGPALSMTRSFRIDCSEYDTLLLSAVAPEGTLVRIIVSTDLGTRKSEFGPVKASKEEYAVDLAGGNFITQVTIEIEATQNGIGVGWLNWLGLQNAKLLERYQQQWNRFDQHWEGYLQDESYQPNFIPTYGILINESDVENLRAQHHTLVERDGQSFLSRAASKAMEVIPENQISEFVNYGRNSVYARNRDYNKILVGKHIEFGSDAAIAGLILKDKNLLRLAARYAMSIGMCNKWQDSMICTLPGGLFDHRCFTASLCAKQVAIILDLAGEMFTDTGRDFLLRRLSEEGMSTINYTTWKHSYVFECNQLAWFTPGRLYGYLVMEREWPHVKPYTDLAYQDLLKNVSNIVGTDGSFAEGPRYFTQVAKDVASSVYYFSQARETDFMSSVPERMKRLEHFAELLGSTDEAVDLIPICNGEPNFVEDTSISFMAALLPESRWVAVYHKVLARQYGKPQSLLALKLHPQISEKYPDPKAFVHLPQMGAMASTRKLGKEYVKILIAGNQADAVHAHEDKGSFVLEFAGDTFAMDPGICEYGHPLSIEYKHCQRHNMLVPVGIKERPAPQNPLPYDVKPKGAGDERSFQASIDASKGWEEYYRAWNRSWKSDRPNELVIHDSYELLQGNGVEFLWQTKLPVEVENNRISIQGRRGRVEIFAPEDCEIRVDSLDLYEGDKQNRIAICKRGTLGELSVRVELKSID